MNTITNDDKKCTLAMEGLIQVYDPEIGLNVVDLGLIYELNFREAENIISCTMTLTTEFCPMGESIVEGVRHSLQSTFQNSTIEVNLTFDPRWSSEKISAAGRLFLGR